MECIRVVIVFSRLLKKQNLVLALLLCLTVVVQAQEGEEGDGGPSCQDAIGCVFVRPGESLRIVYMLALSEASFYGIDQLGSIQVALDERDGQLLGFDIQLIEVDAACSERGGQMAAETVIAMQDVIAVIGTSCSSSAASAMPLISEAGLVMISPSNTMPQLTRLPGNNNGGLYHPGYFRTVFSDEVLGVLGARFASQVLGAQTIATINDETSYSIALANEMAASFQGLGGRLLLQGEIRSGSTDMSEVLTEVAAVDPDLLFLPLWDPEASIIARQLMELEGLEDTILMITDTAGTEFAVDAEGGGQGVYIVTSYLESEAYDAFVERYTQVNAFAPTPSTFHAHAYDAAKLLFDTIESVAVVRGNGTLSIGRQALRDALTATENYPGVTGRLSCTPTGDCGSQTAMGVFMISQENVGDAWVQDLVYTPTVSSSSQ